MNFKYDIPYAKKGQMTLEVDMFGNGFWQINSSKDKSRLLKNLKISKIMKYMAKQTLLK